MARSTAFQRTIHSPWSRRIGLLILVTLCAIMVWQTKNSNSSPSINILPKDTLNIALLDAANNAPSSPKFSNSNMLNQDKPTLITLPPVAEAVSQKNAIITGPANIEQSQTVASQEVKPQKEPLKAPDTNAGKDLFTAGKAALESKNYIVARDKLSQAVKSGLDKDLDTKARQMLAQAADYWLFSNAILASDTICVNHKLSSGEVLAKIQNKYKVSSEFLEKINKISNPKQLAAGQSIKAVQGPFSAVVERSKFRLTVYINDVLVKSYPITIGVLERETPTGLWKVAIKQVNPAWTDPDTNKVFKSGDPANPLGERWISLEGIEGNAVGRTGFGIHGTIEPDKIGKTASRGCIRLNNSDIKELYDLLMSNVSQVRIID